MEYLPQPLVCISVKCSTFTFTLTYFGISKTNIHFTCPICLLKFYIYPHPIGIVKWILPPNTWINNLFGTIVQAFGRLLLSFFNHFLIKNKSGKGWCITYAHIIGMVGKRVCWLNAIIVPICLFWLMLLSVGSSNWWFQYKLMDVTNIGSTLKCHNVIGNIKFGHGIWKFNTLNFL
jgi:hypothetical protein